MSPAKRRRASKGLLGKRIILCMGAGGVGKTSTAAALALAAAENGARCALVTVDPAKRLRSALGLDELSMRPTALAIAGTGSLDAMALDTKSAFDDLIRRVAPSDDLAEAILANPLYREVSDELGGSTEYMAMEKLHELAQLDYDLVVVDTPPGAHAGDLLGAPSRMRSLVESGAAAVLRAPSSILGESRLANLTLRPLLAALERWVGKGLIANLGEFATAFEPLLAGFAARAQDVDTLLRRRDTAIVLVTNTEAAVVERTADLAQSLDAEGLRCAAAIANQVQKLPPKGSAPALRCAPELRAKLRDNYAALEARAAADRKTVREIGKRIAPVAAAIPRLSEPIASRAQLEQVAELLNRQLGRR